jgi:hypothetical protein
MMKKKNHLNTSFVLIFFVLELFLSSGFQPAWSSGTAAINYSGYNEAHSEIIEDQNFCAKGNQCGGSNVTTKQAGCDDPNICPNWFRRYIINPIRGALRTNFD